MDNITLEQNAKLYSAALDSVNLLKAGEPIGFVGNWAEIEQTNKDQLRLMLDYKLWTTEDLTPLQEALNNESPSNVQPTTPSYNPLTQGATEGYPVKTDGVWYQTWIISDLTLDEQQAQATAFKNTIAAQTQARLDNFARTRSYDGILSLCTYASSAVPKFAAEGQYGVNARDATWAKLYEMLAEVEAGTRPVPAGFADIEPELPVLAWPV